ncbi:MAG: Succinate dehydrogenase cytochrome b558 subunit [Fimbriimonadaceae bacterium]|nr:Succinate dehydrogenase cytochrome b558 subunit [Fimbriimonadaceae bacterium]
MAQSNVAFRESYFWHKVHSLTGIIPIGFYMVQHLTLNSFSIAGPDKFDSVISFFAGVPKHLLLALEFLVLGLPILFHAIYGLIIIRRAEPNISNPNFQFLENRMFGWQRWTGVFLFFLLIAHVMTTTLNAKINGEHVIYYQAWQDMLTSYFYLPLLIYAFGIICAAYHLSYGVWNFCIRWGITVSEQSQLAMQKASAYIFFVLLVLGWGALGGFLIHKPPSGGSGGSSSGIQVRL